MADQNNNQNERDTARGARDHDPMHSGDDSILDKMGNLSKSLSNDENGFSNSEGFNTDEGHEPLAGSGGSGTSDINSLDNDHDINASGPDNRDTDQSSSGNGFGRRAEGT